jgi:hypothetical protein
MEELKSKECSMCHKRKSLDMFHKNSRSKDGLQSRCKKCAKIYYNANQEKIKKQIADWYESHKEEQKNYYQKYNSLDEIKSRRSEYHIKYYTEKRDEILEQKKAYRKENKEQISKAYKIYRANKQELIQRQQELFNKSPAGKRALLRAHYKRKNWGFKPLNQMFEGAEFHHLHRDLDGNIDHEIGIFLPKYLHRSIYHNWKSWQGMDDINALAIGWYNSNID